MKRICAALVLLVAAQMPVPADAETGVVVRLVQDVQSSNAVPAELILADVLSRLPKNALFIAAHLQSKSESGQLEVTLNVEIFLQLGKNPTTARYTIMDEYRKPLEQLTVTRENDGKPRYEYLRGNPLKAAPEPELFKPVQGTDVSWSDLTLSFLWWRNGVLVGTEKIRGQQCMVVKVQPPRDESRQSPARRLWIDEQHRILLQATEYDAQDKPLRSLAVKSFRKIDDEWMIKDLEIESLPSGHRTFLRVREMQKLGE